jgi:hypothetical protein
MAAWVCRSTAQSFRQATKGRKNQNWHIRSLPPFTGGHERVVFTTPYVVVDPDFDEWLAYFRPNAPATDGFADYEGHMKYGPTRQYWNDYVFEINVNVTRTHPPARPQTADSIPRNPDTGTTGKLHDPPRSRPPPADDIARTRSRNARRH